jgi:hypothetical protein
MSEEQGNLEFVFADLTGDELAICRAALHAILRGEAVDRGGLVAATGFTSNKVGALLEGLSKRGLVVVEPNSGRVVGSWGLSLPPTEHRLNIRGRELHAWCALDAVGIPAGLGEDATIASRCHLCGARLNVAMVDGCVSHVAPTDARLLMIAGRAGRSVVGFT